MKVRTLLLLLTLVAIAVFTALNWSAFMTPTTLSLGVANVQAPLGLVMLGLVAFLAALFLVFVVYLQTSVLLEAELKKQAGLDAESRAIVLARLDQLDRDLRSAVEQSGNTLAAYIGELEDRLERGRAT